MTILKLIVLTTTTTIEKRDLSIKAMLNMLRSLLKINVNIIYYNRKSRTTVGLPECSNNSHKG